MTPWRGYCPVKWHPVQSTDWLMSVCHSAASKPLKSVGFILESPGFSGNMRAPASMHAVPDEEALHNLAVSSSLASYGRRRLWWRRATTLQQ